MLRTIRCISALLLVALSVAAVEDVCAFPNDPTCSPSEGGLSLLQKNAAKLVSAGMPKAEKQLAPKVKMDQPQTNSTIEVMTFVGHGCCRFDGWSAKHQGYQTAAACRQICADAEGCVAADMARPQGDKYDCYNFYGSGANFTLQCGTSNTEEKCYRKEVLPMAFLGNGCCRFDGWSAKHQGYQTEAACLQTCADTADCIAADMARPQGDKYDCYNFFGSGKNFKSQCGTSNADEKCFRKTAPAMTFVGNGCCRFDGWEANHEGYQTPEACLQACADTPDCIAADMARPQGDKLDCYNFYGSGENFKVQCDTSNNVDKCYRKELPWNPPNDDHYSELN